MKIEIDIQSGEELIAVYELLQNAPADLKPIMGARAALQRKLTEIVKGAGPLVTATDVLEEILNASPQDYVSAKDVEIKALKFDREAILEQIVTARPLMDEMP